MQVPRKYVQKLHGKNVGGAIVIMYVFEDMTNQELAESLAYFTEREDFEYCEALVAEAELRGIKLTIKQNNK